MVGECRARTALACHEQCERLSLPWYTDIDSVLNQPELGESPYHGRQERTSGHGPMNVLKSLRRRGVRSIDVYQVPVAQ